MGENIRVQVTKEISIVRVAMVSYCSHSLIVLRLFCLEGSTGLLAFCLDLIVWLSHCTLPIVLPHNRVV